MRIDSDDLGQHAAKVRRILDEGGLQSVKIVASGGLDENALLGFGDLGPLGQTWSLGGPSYAGGILYHRSLKEVVALRATP